MFILMIIAGVLIGALVPEWILMLSHKESITKVPFIHNIMMAVALGILFGFIAGYDKVSGEGTTYVLWPVGF